MGLGYGVLIACYGKTGIFAAESCKPSLVLLDMLMPDMDGIEVLRALKRTPSTSEIPVLAISSMSEKNAKKLIEEGAAGEAEQLYTSRPQTCFLQVVRCHSYTHRHYRPLFLPRVSVGSEEKPVNVHPNDEERKPPSITR
jgi:CheY-like chemotaxis protein